MHNGQHAPSSEGDPDPRDCATAQAEEPLPSPEGSGCGFAIPGYDLVRPISHGAQAVVYLAFQRSTGRKVAVKVLKWGPMSGPAERARFDREARILAVLNHPGVVPILDRGATPEGWSYLVMDYVPGRSLDEHLVMCRRQPAGKPTGEAALLRLFLKIADAVNAAHLRGVVHRDLKPSNIRVDEHGEPRVLDFGIARSPLDGLGSSAGSDGGSSGPLTMTGQFVGSLPWASPEQAEGRTEAVDQRSDVYALGIILYQMLTGRFPYEVSGSFRDVMNNILTAAPVPPSQVSGVSPAPAAGAGRSAKARPGSPPAGALDAIVLRALAKPPDDRYSLAGDMARDVATYMAGLSTVTSRATAQPSRRALRTVLTAVGGGVTVTALVGLVIWALQARPVGDARSIDATGHMPATVSATASIESPPAWNEELRGFIDQTLNSSTAKSAGRGFYGEVVRVLDHPEGHAEWRIGHAMTRTQKAYSLFAEDRRWFARELSAEDVLESKLHPKSIQRSVYQDDGSGIDNDATIWKEPLLTLTAPRLALALADGKPTLVMGSVTCQVEHARRFFDLMFVLTAQVEGGTVNLYQHVDAEQLPRGPVTLTFEIPESFDAGSGVHLSARAFLHHPKPGTYQISNEVQTFLKGEPTTRSDQGERVCHFDWGDVSGARAEGVAAARVDLRRTRRRRGALTSSSRR